jgi:hypothetical protein
LFYGDESQVCEQGYVPYGWQFAQEAVCIPFAKGVKVNLFGLISKSNQFFYQSSKQKMTAHFVVEHLDRFSFMIRKPIVIVLGRVDI